MIYKMWRQEWNFRGLTLNHHTPEQFTRCHWQKAERVKPQWVVYRAVLAAYFAATLVYSIFLIGEEDAEERRRKFPIFLTHWTYVVESVQYILAFIIVSIKARSESIEPDVPMKKMPWYYKMYWALHNIALPSSVTVTVIFWASIYDPELFPVNALNLMEHAFNSILALFDFCLVGHPIKLLHFYLPCIYALIYAVFSLIYQLSGGTGVKGMIPIYEILDWRKPCKAIFTCFFSFMFLLILFVIFSLLHNLKVWIKKKIFNDQNET